MKTLIATAMDEGRQIHFLYDGKPKTVEARCLVKADTAEAALLAWQVHPPCPDGREWQMYRLDKIYALRLLSSAALNLPRAQAPSRRSLRLLEAA